MFKILLSLIQAVEKFIGSHLESLEGDIEKSRAFQEFYRLKEKAIAEEHAAATKVRKALQSIL